MAAEGSSPARSAFLLILSLVVVGLGYLLYRVVTDPWQGVLDERELTGETRGRMSQVRNALIVYERENQRYPLTLDSLVTFVKTDSFMVAKQDSLFAVLGVNRSFNPDSLPFSPRTGNRFEYAVNDTAEVKIYLLKDPDSDDQIGTLEPVPSMRNASNWE